MEALSQSLGRVGCIHCDLPITLGALEPGERAYCPRCGNLLTARNRDPLTRSLALALTALVLLALANAFPFMSLEAKGLEKVMTLPRTAVELHDEGYTTLAVLVLGVIAVVPALMLLTIVALTIPLIRGEGRPWLIPAGRALSLMSPWCMVEVFIIGVIVSLVKIIHMAHVSLGLSFFSYVAFTICFIATLTSLDRLTLWREIERCTT